MTLITKPDFTYVWASGGTIVAPNDAKKQLGWLAEAPPFQYDNWLQNRQDQMLAHINQRGIPAWDGLTNYEAAGLSYVQGSDGKIYKSVATSGPATTVQDPTTDATDTYWTVAFADVGAFLTQVAGDARYTQRSNNLSDITNTATARTNLGVVQATETASGLVELATSAETITGTDSARAVTPIGLAALTATDARRGLVELATTAEVQAGTDTARAITPAGLASYSKSLTANGWMTHPSGIIEQWGVYTVNTAGIKTITLPITYPHSQLGVMASSPSSSSASGHPAINAITASNFQVYVDSSTTSNALGTIFWRSWGF